jgi:membrane protease YdiL (CAAX protease family)
MPAPWLIGAVIPLELLPGLPVSTLNVFCPLIAASVLVYREDKASGVTELLKRSFDYRRIRAKVWYVPTVLLMPGITILAYGLMRLLRLPLPAPQFPGVAALVLFLVSFIAALGEELGWSGYAIDPMQDRWNALQASILLGLVWATWHIVPLVQAQRSLVSLPWRYGFLSSGSTTTCVPPRAGHSRHRSSAMSSHPPRRLATLPSAAECSLTPCPQNRGRVSQNQGRV